jgi:chromosome segregation ATPase
LDDSFYWLHGGAADELTKAHAMRVWQHIAALESELAAALKGRADARLTLPAAIASLQHLLAERESELAQAREERNTLADALNAGELRTPEYQALRAQLAAVTLERDELQKREARMRADVMEHCDQLRAMARAALKESP